MARQSRPIYKSGTLRWRSTKATCKLFKIMEVAEKIYKYDTTSKIPIRVDTNRASFGRKQKGVESASPTNLETGHSG